MDFSWHFQSCNITVCNCTDLANPCLCHILLELKWITLTSHTCTISVSCLCLYLLTPISLETYCLRIRENNSRDPKGVGAPSETARQSDRAPHGYMDPARIREVLEFITLLLQRPTRLSKCRILRAPHFGCGRITYSRHFISATPAPSLTVPDWEQPAQDLIRYAATPTGKISYHPEINCRHLNIVLIMSHTHMTRFECWLRHHKFTTCL